MFTATRLDADRRAPGLLVAAALLFAAMALVAKRASARLPGTEVAFVRFAVGLAACGIASRRIRLQARNRLGLAMRGAFGGAAVLLYFLAIAHLPVGIATLLNYTAPVFATLYAARFLGEAVGRATIAALGLTTVGVTLVIAGTVPAGSFTLGIWQLVGVGSAMLSGAAVATIREVRKTDGSWEIFTAFCAMGCLFTAPGALLGWVRPGAGEWAALLAVGLLSLVAQLLMTFSLRFVPVAVGGVIAQLTPAAAMALGWIVLHEHIGGLALGGASLTLLGVSLGTALAARANASR